LKKFFHYLQLSIGGIKIEQWYNQFPHIYTYNPNDHLMDDNVKLSCKNRMSPLTNFFLNVFLNTMEKKNIIVTIPDNILRPIPIISYLFSNFSKKSTLIFTQKGGKYSKENILEAHRKNYYLLNYGTKYHGEYLFSDIPIGIISRDKVEAKVYIPRAEGRDNKQHYIKIQEENFLKSTKPKIFLDFDEKSNKINEIIKNLVIDDKSIDVESKINLGLVIFENVDRFINSKFSSKVFFKWIKPLLDKKIQIIFHFSNTESKYINLLKERSNSFVLPWKPVILAHESIKDKSINYFNKLRENPEKMKLIAKYNIDNIAHYDKITDRKTIKPILESGNIDYHYNYSKMLIKNIEEDILTDRILYYTILSAFYDLPNILINPSKYKKFYYNENIRGHFTLSDLIRFFKEQNRHNENNFTIKYLASEIYSVLNELSDCKRYGEKISFKRIGKDYRILDIINDANICINNKNVIFATYSPFERNILSEEISSLPDNFDIQHIKFINKSAFDRSNVTLVLPGPLRLKYFSELLRPYKNIYFLSYDGKNYNTIQEQVNLVQEYSLQDEEESINYLKEIYDFMDIPKDILFTEHKLKAKKEDLEHIKSRNEIDISIKDIIQSSTKYPLIEEYEKEMQILDEKSAYMKNKYADGIYNESEGINVILKKFNGTEITKRKLPLDKTYLYLKEIDGNFEEDTPDKLFPGFYIIILDNNERKSLLELIIDISGMEESVDKDLIESWKNKLNDFKKEHNLNIIEFKKYLQEHGIKKDKQTVRNWLNGIVLGPKYPKDILLIGKALNDIELIENYKIIEQEISIVRQIHRNMGKSLKKIIRDIFNGDLDLSKLSYQEIELYESIKDGIYEVKEVISGDSQ